MDKTKQWFEDNVAAPLKVKNIFIKLKTVRVENTLRKPGPVFLEIARAAYNRGAQYMYRCVPLHRTVLYPHTSTGVVLEPYSIPLLS
jgi:hypothetical protein